MPEEEQVHLFVRRWKPDKTMRIAFVTPEQWAAARPKLPAEVLVLTVVPAR